MVGAGDGVLRTHGGRLTPFVVMMSLLAVTGSVAALTLAPAAARASSVRPVRVAVPSSPIVRHGPFVLTAAQLAGFRPGHVVEGDDFRAVRGRVCRVRGRCARRISGGGARDLSASTANVPQSSPLTANLTSAFLNNPIGVADPQIAVGPVYIVTTQRNVFGIYDKSGAPVTQTLNGQPATYKPDLCDLFAPLVGDLNAHADLPGGSSGITVANGYGFNCADPNNKPFYDARMVWDEFRHRYWIAALAINNKVVRRIRQYQKQGVPVPPVWLGARRGKFVVAVSQTSDPRGGWSEYWFDANKGDGLCNPKCSVENGADYPFVGMSQHYFLWESIAGEQAPVNKEYRHVAVINADALAGVSACSWNCGWDFAFSGSLVNPGAENVGPVVDHTAAPDHDALFVSPRNGDQVRVWTFRASPGSLSWNLVDLDVNPFDGLLLPVYQPGTPSVPNPTITTNNAGNQIMRAAYRDSRVVLTFSECAVWSGSNACTSSVRYIELRHAPSGWVVHRDRTIGDHSLGEKVIVGYAYPEVEINKNDDVAVDYMRSGSTVFPEARYSTYVHNQGPVVWSGLIAKGDSSLPGNPAGGTDTGGISIDGSDDGGIWMMHAYAYKAGYSLAVAKVFGTPHPDLILSGFDLRAFASGLGPAGRSMKYAFRLTVRNQADGPASATTGAVSRAGPGSSSAVLRSFDVPALRPGRSAQLTVTVTVPTGAPLTSARIAIVPVRSEYSTTNNIAIRQIGPEASFSFQPSSPIAGSAINFDASSSTDPTGQIATYAWDFSDGSTGSGKIASHSFAQPGSYAVRLTATDQSGLADTATNTITVGPGQVTNPLPDLAVQSIDSVTEGTGALPTCTVTYTLTNVGTAPAGPSTTHVVLAETAGSSSSEGTVDSPALAAGNARQEHVTLDAVGRSCTPGTTATVTANSTGTVAEADAGNDTNNTQSRSF